MQGSPQHLPSRLHCLLLSPLHSRPLEHPGIQISFPDLSWFCSVRTEVNNQDCAFVQCITYLRIIDLYKKLEIGPQKVAH